ncbi:MAG TPA: ABC transporter permease [Solirubrobacteraceae bacterium]|nr:ABC transporter permease [Solirubrobacteraceae bacterium]
MSAQPLGEGQTSAPVHGWLYWQVSDAIVLTGRALRHIPRNPQLLVFSTIQPVMFVVLFRYVLGGAIRLPPGVSYVNYLMAGVFVNTVAFGSFTTGVGLAEDLQRGLIDRFRSLPMSRAAVLIGRTLSDLVRNFFTGAVMFAVGLLVGFNPQGGALEIAAAVGMLLLLGFAFSWIGATIGLAVRNVEAVQSAGLIWLFPLIFASSAFVPTKTMPAGLRAFANEQPITKITDAVRGWFLGTPVHSSGWLAAVWCVGILVVFVPLSVRVYRRAAAKS